MSDELLEAAIAVVHADDAGGSWRSFANDPHLSGCRLCRAITTAQMVAVAMNQGLVR